MEIKHGAISADSHVAHGPDDFTSRMSVSKWGDKIPHTVMMTDVGSRAKR